MFREISVSLFSYHVRLSIRYRAMYCRAPSSLLNLHASGVPYRRCRVSSHSRWPGAGVRMNSYGSRSEAANACSSHLRPVLLPWNGIRLDSVPQVVPDCGDTLLPGAQADLAGGGVDMPEHPGYWQRRRICRDHYSKCRKGCMSRIMAAYGGFQVCQYDSTVNFKQEGASCILLHGKEQGQKTSEEC